MTTKSRLRLLVVTGGHSFDETAFAHLVEAVVAQAGCEVLRVGQPDALRCFHADRVDQWDVALLHDLPGLGLKRGTEPVAQAPSAELVKGLVALTARGNGIVATHHALAGWPTWDAWANLLGGRFLYAPGHLGGMDTPASGYRMDSYRVHVQAPDHPVCQGVDDFELFDELYLCPVFDQQVTPLVATNAAVSPKSMIDTHREVRYGERMAAVEQHGSQMLGWAQQVDASRVVYLLPGHTPATLQHPQYQRLVANAVRWTARQR